MRDAVLSPCVCVAIFLRKRARALVQIMARAVMGHGSKINRRVEQRMVVYPQRKMAASGIAWDDGRVKLHAGVQKMIDIIEGGFTSSFTYREHMELYSLVYTMCTQKAPRNYSPEIYQEYDNILRDYCTQEILPVIQARVAQSDDAFLAEFIKRWKNHKLLVRQVYEVCYYLDRYHVQRQNISSLRDVGVSKFRTLVFNPIKDRCGNPTSSISFVVFV